MTTFAAALKAEIVRLARKELRGEVAALRQALTKGRGEIATLKKDVRALQTTLRVVSRQVEKSGKASKEEAAVDLQGMRYRKDTIATIYKRKGIDKAQLAALCEETTNMIARWEHGKSVPSPEQQQRILAIRAMSKEQISARLMA